VRIKRAAGIVVAGVLAAAASARAQDVQIKVAIDQRVLRDVGVDIARIVQSIEIPRLSHHVGDMLRDLASELRGLRELDGLGATVAAWQRGQNTEFKFEQTHRDTRTLAIGPTGTFELKGVSGEITVTAGGGGEATVDMVRRSRGRTEADAALGLKEIVVDVDHRGERAVVSTRRANDGRLPYRVDVTYTVTVPTGTQVVIGNMSGTVTVNGVKGGVGVEVLSGDVKVTGAARVNRIKTMSGTIALTDVESEGTLEAGTFSGGVILERVKARRIDGSTMSGEVIGRDLTAEDVSLTSVSGGVEYSGALSRTGRYDLRAHSGNVRLIVANGVGFELDASTFSGTVRSAAELGIKMNGAGRGADRRRFRGTVGSGGAMVTASTLSGDVVISRK
jgi:hypothetical protein